MFRTSLPETQLFADWRTASVGFGSATLVAQTAWAFYEGAMQNILIVVQLVVSVALIGVVLLQRSEGGALGIGGGGSGLGGLFSPRGAADTLIRTTAILAAVFFLSSLALTLFALHGRPQSRSILEQQTAPGQTRPIIPVNRPAPAPGKPVQPAPSVPAPH